MGGNDQAIMIVKKHSIMKDTERKYSYTVFWQKANQGGKFFYFSHGPLVVFSDIPGLFSLL